MHKRPRKRIGKSLAVLLLISLVLGNFAMVSTAFAGDTSSSRKIDVWDFGGVQVPPSDPLYGISNNQITTSTLDGLTSYVSSLKLTGTKIPFGDVTLVPASGDRLYYFEADGTAGANSYGTWSPEKYAYPDSYNANGAYYANGTGGTARRYFVIDNVVAGDKITVYGGTSNGFSEQVHFVYPADPAIAAKSQDDQLEISGTPAILDFIAKYSGSYQIYVSTANSGKPYFHRVVRTPGVKVSGSVNLNGSVLPSGYALNFTNQTTNDTTVVSVNADNTFDAVLTPGYSYTATLKDISAYSISDATKVVNVTASDISAGVSTIRLDVVSNALVTISGNMVGFDSGYDVSRLQLRFNPPEGSLAPSVTAAVDTTSMAFTAAVRPGVQYTAALSGVNDYDVTAGGSVSITGNTSQNITVSKKPVYTATGNFLGLSPTAQVQSITFTNVDDGYAYPGTVANGGYTVNLRDGAYSVTTVCTETYSTIDHVVVNGQNTSKDMLFAPANPVVEPLPWVPDLYVGDSSKSNNYSTVKDALAAAARMNPASEAQRITIHIAPGVYRAQLKIATPYITLVNSDPSKQVKITWYYGVGYNYYSVGSDGFYDAALAFDQYAKNNVGSGKWGASVYLTGTAKAFRAENIVFENSFNKYLTDEELADGVELGHVAGSTIAVERTRDLDVTSRPAQERAAAMAIDADDVEFRNCSFIGGQDTLYTGAGAASMYFKDSFIEGNTDFIFGDGNVAFDNSTLNLSGYSDASQAGYITAAKDAATNGYLFLGSTVTASRGNQAPSFFGRPWGAGAKVTFINTKLQNGTVIDPAGWTSMSGNQPQNAHFAEYGTTLKGAPADTSRRVAGTVLNDASSVASVSSYFGSDWTPDYYNPSSSVSLSAAAGDTKATLGWNTVAGATYYMVKRGTTIGTYAAVTGSVYGTDYTDNGLSNGTAYYYVVTAYNAAGAIATSNAIIATPTVLPAQPAAATGLSAIADDAKAILSWNAAADAAYYKVKRGTASGTYTTIASNVTGTSYTDGSVKNGTAYYYVVTAVNAGGESAASNEVKVTPTSSAASESSSAYSGRDIGTVGIPGSTIYNSSSSEFMLTGSGVLTALTTGQSSDLDSFQFAGPAAQLSGDGTIIAKVRSFDTGGASNPVLGLMVRTSMDPNSNYAGAIITPAASSTGTSASYTPYYVYRDASQNKNTKSGTASAVTTAADGTFYLKLAYQGSSVSPGDTTSVNYKSYIGVADDSGNIEWTPAKTTSTKSAVSNSYYIGFFAASDDQSKTVTVNFDNVTVETKYDTDASTPVSALDGMGTPSWAGTGMVTSEVATNGDVKLTWNAAYDNVGVAKYNIYQGSNLVASTADGSATTFAVTKAMVTGIDPAYDPTARAYTFSVQAVDAAGNESADGPATSSDIQAPTWTAGKLSAATVTQNRVALTWSGASDNIGITGYKVYDFTNSANPVVIAAVDGNTTQYTVMKLNSSSAYVFKVEAGDSSGNWTSDGPSLSVSTTAPIADNESPTWLSGRLTASNLTQTGVSLTWSNADDNVGVEKYYLYQGSSATPVATVDSSLNTYAVTGLAPSTSYAFSVQAVDEAGNISKDGPTVTVTTPAAPSWQAASLSASNAIAAQPDSAGPVYRAVQNDSVTLTWSGATDPIGVTGYNIYQEGIANPVATVDAGTDSFTVIGLTPGLSYTFKVEAVDNAGCLSADGPSVEVTMPSEDATLLPPQHVSVPALAYDDTSITLVWSKPDNYAAANIADYNVYMDGKKIGTANNNTASPAKPFVDSFYNDPGNSSAVKVSHHSYIVTGLEPNTTHTFTVRSVDNSGNESADSNAVTQATTAAPQIVDVTQYGAVGDGVKLDTAAIQAAIDATPPGGKVVLPAGKTFISGSLFIKMSNITFEVDGTLKASDNAADFPYPDPTHTSAVKTYSLLNAIATDTPLSNIRITGTGTIDGNGWKQGAPGADGLPVSLPSSVGTVTTNGILAAAQYNLAVSWGFSSEDAYKTRSNLVTVTGVNNVYVGGGLSIVNPSQHTLSVGSTNVTLNGVKILTYDNNNGDGVNMSGSGLTVINSVFDTGDDDINFAAGVGAAAENNAPVQNVWIFDNYFRHGHGAVVAGSNTAAWIQNIIAEDNVMNGIGVGLRAKTGAGVGGGARNIVFRDSAMKDVSDGDEYPFEFTSAYPSSTSDPAPDMGRFKHIFVSNVSVDSSTKSAIFVSGTSDAPHEDIHFNKVAFNNTPATSINYLKNSSFTNVSFTNVVKGAAPWNLTNTVNTAILSDTAAPSWTSGKLTASNVGANSLSLVWSGANDDTGVTAYRLYQGSSLAATVAGSVHSYDVTGLTAGTAYTFTVQAGDAAGNWSTDGPSVTVNTVDSEAPVTTDNAPVDWVNHDVTVTLTATDSGSGVETTYYTVDGGAQQTGTTVTITAEGTHTLAYWSVDKAGNTEAKHTAAVQIDKTVPTAAVALNKNQLWPPNHQLTAIAASVNAADSLSGVKSIVLTSITSNEPDNGEKDGDQPNDIQGADIGTYDTSFMLRAERAGNGKGRIYTITYSVTDNAGNIANASATVTVPHDQSGKK